MTYYEKIMSMSIDELAQFLLEQIDCPACPACYAEGGYMCSVPDCCKRFEDWLNSEVENNDGQNKRKNNRW